MKKHFLTCLAIFLFSPFLAAALEETAIPESLFYKICSVSLASPQECRQFALYSPRHKLYFLFCAAYDIGKPGSSSFDHVFIFRNSLNEQSLAFYWEPAGKSSQIQQILDRNFNQDIPEDKFRYTSSITIHTKAAVASYFLKKKFFIRPVYLHDGIKVRSANREIKEIKPEFLDIAAPVKLAMPFDLSKISVEAKNLPQEKLSAKTVRKFDNGFLFRTLKNKYYYIRETADGIYLAAFVDGEMVINGKFSNEKVTSQLFRDKKFVQVLSNFKPFKCEIYLHSPAYAKPLLIKVRNNDCEREVFSVNTIRSFPE